jgi:hypothetical protein
VIPNIYCPTRANSRRKGGSMLPPASLWQCAQHTGSCTSRPSQRRPAPERGLGEGPDEQDGMRQPAPPQYSRAQRFRSRAFYGEHDDDGSLYVCRWKSFRVPWRCGRPWSTTGLQCPYPPNRRRFARGWRRVKARLPPQHSSVSKPMRSTTFGIGSAAPTHSFARSLQRR